MSKIFSTVFTLLGIFKHCSAETAIGFQNKSSLGNLVGQPQDAHFGKSVFFLADVNEYLVYGHEDEDYYFTYWVGKVLCGDGYWSTCDDRSCGVPGGTATCDTNEKPPYCKCKYKQGSYLDYCEAPKMVFDVTMYYYGKNESPDTETVVRTQNFIATCKYADGQTSIPENPLPDIQVTTPDDLAETDVLEFTISFSGFVAIPKYPVFYWTVHTIQIRINKVSIALFLDKIGVKPLASILDKNIIRKISEFQNRK